MGDRFYMQQKTAKVGRRLKKDIVVEVNDALGCEVSGLDKLTVASLDSLLEAVRRLKYDS